ncbi:MAG: hypothetical protein O3C27_16685, partial [Actinomycetota bacterium]|nr:hypothetical protein [Actinomycetota bacterium]
MHPIEQLRYVARASGADASLLVQEAASALGVFGRDPAGLVTACRRLLTRQPEVGPLWWMSARMVTSGDARAEARLLVSELNADPTARTLSHELPDSARVLISGWPDLVVSALPRRGDVSVLVLDVEGQGHSVVRRLERADMVVEAVDPAHVVGAVEESSLVLLEAAALGPAAALVDVGSVAAAAVARVANRCGSLPVPDVSSQRSTGKPSSNGGRMPTFRPSSRRTRCCRSVSSIGSSPPPASNWSPSCAQPTARSHRSCCASWHDWAMTPASSPFYNDDHRAYGEIVRQFTAKEITPNVHEWDLAGEVPRE